MDYYDKITIAIGFLLLWFAIFLLTAKISKLSRLPGYIASFKKKKRARLFTYIKFDFFTIKSRKMATTGTVGQYVTLELAPKDRRGNPAKVESSSFTSSNSAVAEVIPDPDNNLKARVNFLSTGTAQIDISVDADLDAGEERLLTDFLAVEVKAEEAVSLGIVVSQPADIEGTTEG